MTDNLKLAGYWRDHPIWADRRLQVLVEQVRGPAENVGHRKRTRERTFPDRRCQSMDDAMDGGIEMHELTESFKTLQLYR